MRRRPKTVLVVVPAIATLTLAACANVNPYGTSTSAQTPVAVGRAEQVQYGKVVSVQQINLHKHANAGSQVAGAAGGAFLAHLLGGGRGKQLATFAGALLGAGVTRSALHKNEKAQRVTVKLDQGRAVAIVEPLSAGSFQPGERVELVRAEQNHVQVVPAPSGSGAHRGASGARGSGRGAARVRND
ncbi:MAG TPA: hypothetical protein VFA95_09135 [Gammaproteobacteria bacterium]|nr:hypothetical protein [Gammaproteobacteria bacterium]